MYKQRQQWTVGSWPNVCAHVNLLQTFLHNNNVHVFHESEMAINPNHRVQSALQ